MLGRRMRKKFQVVFTAWDGSLGSEGETVNQDLSCCSCQVI